MQFVDSSEPRLPLDAGITVEITQAGTSVFSGTTDGSGDVTFTPTNGVEYVASFSGTGAPTTTQTFFGGTSGYLTAEDGSIITTESGSYILIETPGTTIVTVDGYASRVPVSIAITPADATLDTDASTQQYACTLTYSDSTTVDVTDEVMWSCTGGTITSGGLYTLIEGSPNTITAVYTYDGSSTLTDSTSVSSPVLGAKLTQMVAETISPTPTPGLRVTQVVAEYIAQSVPPGLFLTQMVAEVISQNIPARVRLTQIALEFVSPNVYTLAVDPPTADISTTQQQQYRAIKISSNGFSQEVPATWETSDPYGTIDENGLYTPSEDSTGSHTITATEIVPGS
jgi:hypothetical protein